MIRKTEHSTISKLNRKKEQKQEDAYCLDQSKRRVIILKWTKTKDDRFLLYLRLKWQRQREWAAE